MTGNVGVAISTTRSRPQMLGESISGWRAAGLEPIMVNDLERTGVAATKNRGIAALLDAGCDHLLLADDDMHPLSKFSWTRYVDDPALHLSLSWGKHRRKPEQVHPGYVEYTWPRGVMLYLHRSVVERVGGMRTEFGGGGHEHVEYSRRIFQAGLSDAMFLDLDQDPRAWFHAEDMPRVGETVARFAARKRRHTTIKRTAADRRPVDDLWFALDGNTDFVPYR